MNPFAGTRTPALTNELIQNVDSKMLWDEYGIVADIIVCPILILLARYYLTLQK